jgi:hypothetical protein
MKVHECNFSAKKTTSGRMLGCYILCSKILVEVNRLTVKIKVDRQQVEGRGSQPSKVEVEDINDKSNEKRLK